MRLFLYSLLTVFASGAIPLCAQMLPGGEETPPMAIGVFGNYHITNHTLNGAQIQGVANCCPDFETLDGSSIAFGALVEFPLSNALRLSLRGGYQNLKATFTATKQYGKGELNNNVVEVTAEKTVEANVPMVTIEPDIAYRLIGGLDVHAGVKAGLSMSPSYHYEERVISDNFTFGGSKTRNGVDGDFENISSMLFTAVVGVSYDLPFGKNIIAPEIRYALPLNKLSSDADWKVATLHLGAAFKIPLRPAPVMQIRSDTLYLRDTTTVSVKGIAASRVRLDGTDTRRDTAREATSELRRITMLEHYVLEQPVRSMLSVSIADVATLGPDGAVVSPDKRQVEQIETADNFPLLPYVFFQEGSSDLGQTKLRLLTSQETALFTTAGLRTDDVLGLYPQLLNIIAHRMRMMPKATLTLTGCNSDQGAEENNTKLSMARAQAIKDYLTSVWGIDAQRLVVKSRNLPAIPSNKNLTDGQEENRRVEMTSKDLLKPMGISNFSYEASFDRVRMTPVVTADAGVRDWKVTVVQNNSTLREFSGTGLPSPVLWDADVKQMAQTRTPLVVRIEVTDNEGQKATDEKTMDMRYLTVQEKRADKKADKLIERYFLVLFDYNRAALNDEHRESIQELGKKLSARSDAYVTIHGYTDRIGTSLSNEQLAQRRAELVKSTLKFAPERVTLLPVGSKKLLFDNDHPVGRFYSRTVEIVVETPVQN